MVALDIAGTSIDEGGAVYVALRTAVENPDTGVPIPDDEVDQWKGTESALRRSSYCSGKGQLDEIDAVESDFTGRLLDAYRSVPPAPLPGIVDAFAVLREHDIKIVLQTGYLVWPIAGRPLEQVDSQARARHRCGDHQ